MEEQLVNMVEERPALYDTNDKNYGNRTVKMELWRDIQLKLNTSEKEIKRRWDSLRTQYSRYLRLPPVGRTMRQNWILSKLHFLEPHMKLKDSSSVEFELDCTSEAQSDSPWTCALVELCDPSPCPETAPIDSPALPLHTESTSSQQQTVPSRPIEASHLQNHKIEPSHHYSNTSQSRLAETDRRTSPHCVKRFRREDSSTSETTVNLMKAISSTLSQLLQEKETKETKEDGISIYLKYLEHRMRSLPQHHLPRLQRDIENLLFTYSVEECKSDL